MSKLKNAWNSISIKWKVFTYLFGFCALLIVVLWLVQTVFLDDFYRAIKSRQISDAANKIEQNIENENLSNVISEVAINSDACIFVISNSGGLVTKSTGTRLCNDIGIIQVSYIIEQVQLNGTMEGYYNKSGLMIDGTQYPESPFGTGTNNIPGIGNIDDHSTTLVYAKNITASNGLAVYMVLTTPITPLGATISTIRIELVYITIGMIALAFLLAFFISRNVSKPIEGINEKAKILAKGEYDIVFDDKGYKEINELSKTLTTASKDLAKVETLRRELIANISHDLRTPLALISGYAEAMRDLPNENNYENAQIIIEEANRLSSLVNDALNISKYQAGVMTLEKSDFNLTISCQQAVKRMAELVKNDGYSITFIADQEITINGDKNKIDQAFYNLLINAINYTGDDKKVIVQQVVDEKMVAIEVSDSGEGIASENLPYIWERYYKVDKTHKRAVTGSGLGLSIVKNIVDMHGGQSGVRTSSTKGSTFFIKFKIK